MRLLALGWYVALCLTLGIVGGLWLDKTFGLLPLFTLLGLLLGLVVAFVGLYRMVSETIEADAAYTAEDDAALASARAAHAAAGDAGQPADGDDDEPEDGEQPDDDMSARQLEARRRARGQRPKPEDSTEGKA